MEDYKIENDISKAKIIEVNDDCVKRIILFRNYRGEEAGGLMEDGSIDVSSEGSAVIEFQNGKKLEATNSEWGALYWL